MPRVPGGEALGSLGAKPKAGPWPERIRGATFGPLVHARPKAAQAEGRSLAQRSEKGAEVPRVPGGEALGSLGAKPKAGP